jgi:predicted TIM-barrel fold metal-dependent hydrolase
VRITDAQIHVWNRPTADRPWPAEGHAYADGDELTAENVLAAMDAAGVHRAILIPPSFAGDFNDTCLDAARLHPARFAVMGRLQLDPRPSGDLISRWLMQTGMIGLRLTFSRPPSREWLREGTIDWLWRQAESADVPIAVSAPGSLDAIARVATAHPGLRLVVDHLGLGVSARDSDLDPVLDDIVGLARHPNIAVKATNLAKFVTDPYPFASLHDRIRRVFDAFGPERMFWGSDLSRLRGSYQEAVDLFVEELGFLSQRDLALVMGRAIETWLRWEPEEGGP